MMFRLGHVNKGCQCKLLKAETRTLAETLLNVETEALV